MAYGWIGTAGGAPRQTRILTGDGIVMAPTWSMTVDDRLVYEKWIQGWKTCAAARGAVIDEANK
ncbi:MAG: hypothetical protein U1C74_16825 [Phenylobacterium sp.]|nr:hypothetical protein [Phenylobacterium sp.]